MAPRGEVEDDLSEDIGGKPPAAPSGLEYTDWNENSVKLKWKPSEDDGGCAINAYIIEFKGKGDEEWQKGPDVKPAKNMNGEVKGLTTGQKYEFRVVAKNRAGMSQPSDATMSLLVKAQKAPPKIDRKAMEEKTVKVNQQLDMSIPVEGEPSPECWWLFNGTEIKSGENVKVSSGTNMGKLLLIPAKRSHMGKYTLKSKNKWGEDECEVDVNVFGKPTIPVGPLEVTEISKKTCHLAWKPPTDNGGNPILQYEVEKMEESMGSWLPAGQPKGTSMDIKNLVEGKKYKFLVRAVNKDGDSPDLETTEFITAKNPYDAPSQPKKPTVKDWGLTWAELSWKEPESDGGSPVKEYVIEMRDVDKRSWNIVGKCKETNFKVEKDIEVGHEYVFRLTAVNAGGESEVSDPSSTIEAMERFVKPRIDKELLGKTKEMVSGQRLVLEAVVVAEPAVKISWFMPCGDVIKPDGEKFIINANEKNQSTLIINDVERSYSGEFKILAKNSVGEDEHIILVTVASPPTRPIGPLEVSNVNPHGCHLSWKKPQDDGGSILQQYTIEKKDVERDYWSSCGKVSGKMASVMKEIEFDVTDLTEYFVYVFRVIAVNVHGESEPLMTNMPVVAKSAVDPPNAPSYLQLIDWDKKWVKLDWISPSGPKPDRYIVEKMETFFIPKDSPEDMEESGDMEEGAPGVPSTPRPPVEQGAPLVKKEQEYVEYSTAWMVAGTTEDDSCEIKISDLSEGNRYRFRVKAVNKAGSSWPSDETDEIVAKMRKQKPVIDKSSLPKNISLARGDNLTLKVKVKGEPITQKSWWWGKREIKASTSVNIDDADYSSKIMVMHLERADTGTFSFRAENEHGTDEAMVDVNVMVGPQKPRGPLKIDNIHAEGCLAAWQAPDDDGGSPITHYIVEKCTGTQTSWMPCGRAPASQTFCDIIGLTPGKEHRIQVVAVNAHGESEGLVCVDGFLAENSFGPPGAPGKPQLVDWDVDHFEVKWTAPKNDGGSRITGYELEARLWKDAMWFRAGEVKMQAERGIVEGMELGQSYAVRVRSKNAAGCGPWSIETDQLTCKHKALKPKVKIQANKEVTIKEGETFTLVADIPSEPPAEDIKWVLGDIEFESSKEGGIVINNTKPNKSIFQKDRMTRKDQGILTCHAANQYGKSMHSIHVIVMGKPTAPEDRLVVSNIHSSGCKLTWGRCKDNGGLPLEYLVEKFDVTSDAWVKQGTTSNTDLLVNDLEPGREYEFRVFAFNELGESEPLQTAKRITAKNSYTVPLPPMAPEVVAWNERSITIQWKEPIDDGGAKITGYHIEARSTGGQWQTWETLDCPERKVCLQKLQKGTEYQFRVIAINKAGKSEPGHASRPKEVKEADLMPYIEAKSMRDTTMAAGDRLRFDLPIVGEPAPQVMWCKGEEPVEDLNDKSIQITNSETHTKIVFNNLKKCHEGVYNVTISNRSGKDSAKVEIKVVDVPAAPDTPLSASVDGNTCELLWKRVKDDGGAPVEYYQIEKFDSDKKSWTACGRTKADWNQFSVKGLMPDRDYKFRVMAVNSQGESGPVVSDNVAVKETDDSRTL